MGGYANLKATRVTADGSIVARPARVYAIWIDSAAGGGLVQIRDGGSGGTVLIPVSAPAAVGGHYIDLPGDGMKFGTNVYADLPASGITSVTIFYD